MRLLHTPGHTPGSQSVLVNGTVTYLLPRDNVPLHANLVDDRFTPNALHVDLESYYASIRRSTAMADVVLPGHDTRVLDHGDRSGDAARRGRGLLQYLPVVCLHPGGHRGVRPVGGR